MNRDEELELLLRLSIRAWAKGAVNDQVSDFRTLPGKTIQPGESRFKRNPRESGDQK